MKQPCSVTESEDEQDWVVDDGSPSLKQRRLAGDSSDWLPTDFSTPIRQNTQLDPCPWFKRHNHTFYVSNYWCRTNAMERLVTLFHFFLLEHIKRWWSEAVEQSVFGWNLNINIAIGFEASWTERQKYLHESIRLHVAPDSRTGCLDLHMYDKCINRYSIMPLFSQYCANVMFSCNCIAIICICIESVTHYHPRN